MRFWLRRSGFNLLQIPLVQIEPLAQCESVYQPRSPVRFRLVIVVGSSTVGRLHAWTDNSANDLRIQTSPQTYRLNEP